MPKRDLVIAIDGPAASGKSSTARRVADYFGYTYIDTGAMYRAVTLAVLRSDIDPLDYAAVEDLAGRITIRLERTEDGSLTVLLDEEDVSQEIRLPYVTAHVSVVSSYAGVRQTMVALQQKMGRNGGVVLDGRDIGTVVFPDADLKIFMVADISARARRRADELHGMGAKANEESLRNEIAERDTYDSSRPLSPLTKAEDAVEIDTSVLSIDQQVDKVIALVRQRIP